MKRRRLVLTAAAVVVLTAFAAVWRASGVPLWVRWQTVTLEGEPEIVLRGKKLCAISNGETCWEMEDGVLTQDVLLCDIDHDGAQELLALCWKRGRYGAHRPFWVTEDERGYSQHIFIYDWTGQTIQPVWMASDIGLDAKSWRFDEDTRLAITDKDGRVSHWDWLSWGLCNID